MVCAAEVVDCIVTTISSAVIHYSFNPQRSPAIVFWQHKVLNSCWVCANIMLPKLLVTMSFYTPWVMCHSLCGSRDVVWICTRTCTEIRMYVHAVLRDGHTTCLASIQGNKDCHFRAGQWQLLQPCFWKSHACDLCVSNITLWLDKPPCNKYILLHKSQMHLLI